MSSAVKASEKLIQRQIESERLRGEREVKTMQNLNDSRKVDLKKSLDSEIVDIKNNHIDHISASTQKKEKILDEMKTHLALSRDLTDKELKSLKVKADKDKVETSRKLSENREKINEDNELFVQEMNDRFNRQTRKISLEGESQIQDMQSHKNDELRSLEEQGKDKIRNKANEFTVRYNTDDKNYKHIKDMQDQSFKNERFSTNQRQQEQLNQITSSHSNQIEVKDKQFRKGLKEQELFFEKKFEGQLKHHQNEFKNLEDRSKKIVDDLKDGLTKEMAKTADRNNDPFFKFEKLAPKLKQFEDRVEIEVEIPEHSKQDIHLTTNGKEAIVTFTRRFADAAKEIDGTINRINKVESFATRVQTAHFLNAKSVKSSYENGVMTYVIKKS